MKHVISAKCQFPKKRQSFCKNRSYVCVACRRGKNNDNYIALHIEYYLEDVIL